MAAELLVEWTEILLKPCVREIGYCLSDGIYVVGILGVVDGVVAVFLMDIILGATAGLVVVFVFVGGSITRVVGVRFALVCFYSTTVAYSDPVF